MTLPRVNEFGFYEMRFESVGGLGANLAGQVLAEAMVLGAGLNGAHFSSYGSEKKGSPVKSNVRLCAADRELRSSSPVERPHLLAIFHECLLKVQDIMAGVYPDSVLVVNSAASPEDIRERAKLASGTVAVVDALDIAVKEGTRINTAMLGAITRASGFINPEVVKVAITRSFSEHYQHLLKPNLITFDRGYEQVKMRDFPFDGRYQAPPYRRFVPALGFANAPMGGVITDPGNTAYKDLSASRQGIYPFYHRDRCIDCGLCTMTCPDFVFVWEPGTDARGKPAMVLKGPNLQYCKGCLKCVEICPVEALTMQCEHPEFRYTADVQLWGPPDYLFAMSRESNAAKWEQEEGYYWYRVS